MAWVTPGLRPETKNQSHKAREAGFGIASRAAPMPEYNAMYDVHLRQLWMNPAIKKSLQSAGFVDETGRAVDVDAHRRKLYVIEQELAQADSVERHRAMEKEIRLRDRQILSKRQEIEEKRIRQIVAVREERRLRRVAMGEREGLQSAPGVGFRTSHSSSSLQGGPPLSQTGPMPGGRY
mmetsp:Transcript_144319/g.462291  ORF Transcript_144319/g.462291 Transcript_144319/m.462291 type:complete len:179 (-) Transcript_144319:278-814(-)